MVRLACATGIHVDVSQYLINCMVSLHGLFDLQGLACNV